MFEGLFQWYESIWGHQGQVNSAIRTMEAWQTIDVLDNYYNGLSPALKDDPAVITAWKARQVDLAGITSDFRDPFARFIEGALKDWISYVDSIEPTTPENAKANLANISAKVIEIFAASAAIDVVAGAMTPSGGDASSVNTKELLKWLGFGAVVAAVAHDPVKIGILRPYQDSLEAAFRNRRPEYVGILNAYRQRSLSEIVVTDTDLITDSLMDEIEADNNVKMDEYGASWGYSDKWITIEKDASTRAITFGGLMAMARLGYYNKGLTIFSLWTAGIDRRVMKQAVSAIETGRDVGMWKGFRSMVEPSYVQGLIEEADLVEYWTKILVPADVQTWALLRLKKSRANYAAKELKLSVAATKDLTKADYTKAYQLGFISQADYETKLAALTYDAAEIDLLVKIADSGKKTALSSSCKHLPLADYELAYNNGLLTLNQVLERMTGEYCEADIALEKQLLELTSLVSDAPTRERDLTVSQITQIYVDGDITKPQLTEYLTQLGYDDQEQTWLVSLANIKAGIAAAKSSGVSGSAAIIREKDLTRSDWMTEFVHNRITQAEFEAGLTSLKYDKNEVAKIVDLANIKKKIPTIEGLKHLPLTDYEKMFKAGQISIDDVLNSMKGIYMQTDIDLERLGLLNGIL